MTSTRSGSEEPRTCKLVIEIHTLIKEACRQTAVAVNIELTLLYWRIGRRIHHREVLGSERAAYGEQIVLTLSRQLSWSHFSALLPLSQPFQREFYAQILPHRERILSSPKSVS